MSQIANEFTTRPEQETKRRAKGFLMVLTAAILWGVSGSVAQVLFQAHGIDPGWIVTVRMGVSGVLLLTAVCIGSGIPSVFALWKNKRDAFSIIVFAVFGLVGVQYSYFLSIAYGNAATATILQYVAPVLVALYLMIRYRKRPRKSDIISVVLAVGGTFFLVTDGHWSSLQVSTAAVVWGLVSAVTLVFYTLYPDGLLSRYGSACVVGWAMFLGSLGLSFLTPPWVVHTQISVQTWGLIGFVVLFGTLIPFYLYLASLQFINGQESSLVACAEPLTAAIVGVAFLGVHLGLVAVLGGICILSAIAILGNKSG